MLLDYEEEEEEMIPIVNTNKHISNTVDGGRRRKLRHISKISTFKRGHDAIKPFCRDLFGVKKTMEDESLMDLSQPSESVFATAEK